MLGRPARGISVKETNKATLCGKQKNEEEEQEEYESPRKEEYQSPGHQFLRGNYVCECLGALTSSVLFWVLVIKTLKR